MDQKIEIVSASFTGGAVADYEINTLVAKVTHNTAVPTHPGAVLPFAPTYPAPAPSVLAVAIVAMSASLHPAPCTLHPAVGHAHAAARARVDIAVFTLRPHLRTYPATRLHCCAVQGRTMPCSARWIPHPSSTAISHYIIAPLFF